MASKISVLVVSGMLVVLSSGARAQFSDFEPADMIDFASIIGSFAPLPDSVDAALFSASLLTIPSKLSKEREIVNGSPSILESSMLYSNRSDSPLYADSESDDFVDFQAYLKKLSTFRSKFGPIGWNFQGWSVLGSGGHAKNGVVGESYINNMSIENYMEYTPTGNTAFFFGQRRMTFGQSLGINPSDVFVIGRELNQNLPSYLSHLEYPGINSFGAEHYSNTIGNFTAVAAAPDPDNDDSKGRFYFSYGTLLGSDPVDLRMFGYFDGEPLSGLSISAPISNRITFYSDFATGYGKGITRVLPKSNAGETNLKTEEDDQIKADITLGVNFALGHGFLISAEYTHLLNGYDETEWKNFDDALKAANPEMSSEINHDLLSKLREIYESSYLRRDYGLLRLYHPNFLGSKIGTDFTVLAGLNDLSGTMKLKLGRDIGKSYRFEAYASHAFGQDSDEFALDRVATYAGTSLIVKY